MSRPLKKISKTIKAKINKAIKARKFELAPTKKIDQVDYKLIDGVIKAMGFRGALVTDESRIGDFISFEMGPKEEERFLKKLNKKLGLIVTAKDFIWKVAEKYKTVKKI